MPFWQCSTSRCFLHEPALWSSQTNSAALMLQKLMQPTQPGLAPNLLHGHGYGQWELEGVVHAMKKSRVWRLRFCNCHFFGSRDFWKVKRMGLEIFSCHHNLAHHFLMDQSAASNTLQVSHLVCISWVVAVCFVECILCCWGITF